MNSNLGLSKDFCKSMLQHNTNNSVVESAIIAPYPYLHTISSALAGSDISWGAQNVSQYESGAYTGEISAKMLVEFGCKYVLVGHSERRTLFAENNDVLTKKFIMALKHNLVPVLCVGESKEQRNKGLSIEYVLSQCDSILSKLSVAELKQEFVIAYEPIWAIGTGEIASDAQISEMHTAIKGILHEYQLAENVSILYGGSVGPANAANIFDIDNVDGGLIGGASLNFDSFFEVITICSKSCSQFTS